MSRLQYVILETSGGHGRYVEQESVTSDEYHFNTQEETTIAPYARIENHDKIDCAAFIDDFITKRT